MSGLLHELQDHAASSMCSTGYLAVEVEVASAHFPMQLDLLSLHLLHEAKCSCQQG